MAEAYGARRRVVFLADQGGDRSADLDALAVVLGREDRGVGLAVGRGLAGLVLVAVEAVDADRIKRLEIALAHAGERQTVEPRVVGDEAHDAAAGLIDDAPLGHAKEAHVQVVEALALWRAYANCGSVRVG